MERTCIINVGDFVANETIYHNRCLSASFSGSGVVSDNIPWEIEGNPWDWEYADDEFIYKPIELPEPPEPESFESKLSDIEEALQILLRGTTE